MNRIKNDQEISLIIMKPTCITKCQIGQDWYKNDLEICFVPDECYPDYMEIQSWIMENIDGHEMNIEDVVCEVRLFLIETYNPRSLNITNKVTGNKVHFDVEVIG